MNRRRKSFYTVVVVGVGLILTGCKDDKRRLADLCLATPNAQKFGGNAKAVCDCAASRTVAEFPNFSLKKKDWVKSFGRHVENCMLGR